MIYVYLLEKYFVFIFLYYLTLFISNDDYSTRYLSNAIYGLTIPCALLN